MSQQLGQLDQLGWFVTGTDTEIGKTLISCALLYGLRQAGVKAAGMKPVAAGAFLQDGVLQNDDALQLGAQAGVVLSQSLATPYLLQAAIAPHAAAALENIDIDICNIHACFKRITALAQAVVVEGIGGFKVPLSAHTDTADMAQQLGLPVILVVGLRLGCLNHALLSAEAIAVRGLTLAAWVANVIDPDMAHADASIASLAALLPAPLLGVVPRLKPHLATDLGAGLATNLAANLARNLVTSQAAAAAAYLDFSRLAHWPAVGVTPSSI